jgi:hypothetical protein
MIKTILVPTSGSDKDHSVFETALAAARPCRAHLAFFHLRVSSGERLRHTPHASSARGKALQNALQRAHQESECRSEDAKRHFLDFCKDREIPVTDAPIAIHTVSASWDEDCSGSDHGEKPFITRARFHDLVVMGRFSQPNGLPPNLIELLLVGCGRPIL